jgi:hypothetical protein
MATAVISDAIVFMISSFDGLAPRPSGRGDFTQSAAKRTSHEWAILSQTAKMA